MAARADALRQPVVDRPDLNLGLQDPKATLYVGQRLVALNDFLGREIGCVGHQQQLAIHQTRMGQGFVVYGVAE